MTIHTIEINRAEIRSVLNTLRFGGMVSAPSRIETADDLVKWLTAYSEALVQHVNRHNEMERQLRELQNQRDAVRKFLGLEL